MQNSPGYQPTASTSAVAPPHQPSTLSAAYSLRSSLDATFPSTKSPTAAAAAGTSHLLHPLGPYDPTHRTSQLSQLQSTLSSIRSAVSAFSALLPPPTDTLVPAPRGAGTPLEKYLALAKETATSESVLLPSLEGDAQRAKLLLKQRDKYAHLYPVLSARQLSKLPEGVAGARGERTLEVLEGIAAGLGLVSFKDTSSHVVHGVNKEVHQLSLGGKVMVIDVEVEAEAGRVLRVKVSYVLESQHESEGTARRLGKMLEGVENLGEGVDELEVERGLQGFRETLRELKGLDEMTEETTLDCFAMHEAMLEALQKVSEGENQTLAAHLVARSHGLLLPITHSHHANILYHASPVAQLSLKWTAAAEQDFAPGDQLEAALAVEGVNSLKVTLVKPSKSTVPLSRYLDDSVSSKPERLETTSPSFDLYHSNTSQWPHFVSTSSDTSPTFLAHFAPGAPITKATGRRIMEVLGHSGKGADGAFDSKATARPAASTTWIEDLLISPRDGGILKYDSSDIYRVSFDDLPFSQDYALADPSTDPGYLCTDVRFQSPAQLYRIIEILKEQLIINNLVTSALAPSNRVASFTAYANKRRKLTTDQAVPSLESLLAPSPSPTLPIFLHLSPTSPSLTLTFPTPNVPPAQASPLAMHITVDAAASEGLRVEVEGRGMEKAERERERLEKVLGRGGDLGLGVRWVAGQLGKD